MTPDKLSREGRFDSFDNGEVLFNKKKNHLPAMGWNSWNAFGSGNTEALTKAMADKFVELGLDKLGYKYIILDDGCYKDRRVDGKLSNDEVKFPSGFRAMADYIHEKNLKFGMYNDIGTNLCAGAEVGTCGHEAEDAASYLEWAVDFLKVDNCYYLWDNATFSNAENAKYTFAPNIRAIKINNDEYKIVSEGEDIESLKAGVLFIRKSDNGVVVRNKMLTGSRASVSGDYVTGIGTFDGTGPDATPIDLRSSELVFEIESDNDREISLEVEYATGKREDVGSWLQVAVDREIFYDDFVKESTDENTFIWSDALTLKVKKGVNRIRLMNHRRQENTLNSYARLLKELNRQAPDNDIIYSACEWGKTQPQNWAYKVCDSWRILNDITFRVGSDGDPGVGTWTGDYTTSVATQYSKAVIMDEFAGLSKGWNDPDMMMIGMNGLNMVQNKTHMTMWCMMNSPLMLGLDLRRVEKGDEIYNIITNSDMIALNQDRLGIQAKRVYSSLAVSEPDKEYIRDINRVDILCKPLAGGRFALSFINVSEEDNNDSFKISVSELKKYFGDLILSAESYSVKNLWTGETSENATGIFSVDGIKACDNVTIVVSV